MYLDKTTVTLKTLTAKLSKRTNKEVFLKADKDVPYEKSVEMARELARIGRPHELITLVNGRHGLWGGDPEKVLQAVDRSMEYIAEHLTKP